MKAIVTDLDGTMWGGVVGEDGPDNLDMSGHFKQYQTLLLRLLQEGVLIGVSTRNQLLDAEEGISRLDPVFRKKLFPVVANWDNKSYAIMNCANKWNISVEDILFIDDSIINLEAATSLLPGLHWLQFPSKEEDFAPFFESIRGHFPKRVSNREDELRITSIISAVEFHREQTTLDPDSFYKGLDAKITIHRNRANDPRTLELVNKTNQFNLNGKRFSPDLWKVKQTEQSFCWSLEYEDKYGPLGVVGVIQGFQDNDYVLSTLNVETFCISCRALDRRIEWLMFALMSEFDQVKYDFVKTKKNTPIELFLRDIKKSNHPTYLGVYDFDPPMNVIVNI